MNLAMTTWNKALEALKEELSTVTYQSHFRSIEPVSLIGKELVVEVGDELSKRTLEAKYVDMVEDALYRAGGRPYKVRFVLPAERSHYEQLKGSLEPISINPKYTFDNFIIGSSNKFAQAAARAVAEKPGTAYNPLFVYSDVGLGKTHLLHAIGNEIWANDNSKKIVYVTSEKFTNELISAIRNDKNEEFRDKYRNVDVLMIDDIQFLSNKEGTQEEFFHTFNELYERQKQIIISSDKPPKEIQALEERLCSRFECGLVADIQKPNIETRVAILQNKSISENLGVDIEVLQFIAERVNSNIRELEGSLTRVVAHSELRGLPITLDLAADALKDFFKEPQKPAITVSYIQAVVEKHFKLPNGELKGKKRNKEILLPRQIAMYLCREMTDTSFENIGKAFSGQHYSTVMHSVEKIGQMIATDAELATLISDVRKRIED